MRLVALTHTYQQPEDSCGRAGVDDQDLSVNVEDAGGGPYLVIKTDRWALDGDAIDAFAAELKAVLAKVPA